jgi:signal transduction histidine kinase
VRADPTRLRQVLTNLVDNALKFTPPGGRVHVSAAPAPDTPGFVAVHVTDTGRGMSPEVVDRIFDRLYQVDGVTDTTRRGLGLGLYLSRQIVTLHGGRIWARSEPGAGSTLSFTLPIVDLHGVGDDQT